MYDRRREYDRGSRRQPLRRLDDRHPLGGKTVSERKLVVTAPAWIGSIVFGLGVSYAIDAGVSPVTDVT